MGGKKLPKKKRAELKIFYLALSAVILSGILPAEQPPIQENPAPVCLDCHDVMAEDYMHNLHTFIDTKGLAAGYNAENSCAVCHLGAENHLEEGGGTDNILGFNAEDITGVQNQQCLQCHAKSHPRFMASSHANSALGCTACHSIHASSPKPSLLKTDVNKTCYSCHDNVFAQFQLNERHRLQEGILTCATCHNPHEPSARERLGGFKHQACLQCHMDKGGPFLYEHGASRIEGCTICHEVHGSPNRHMLITQSISDLCFSCHTFAPSWHSRFTHDTSNCITCHSSIHGSNLDKIFLK